MSWLFYGYRLNPIETLLELLPGVVCTRRSSSKTVQNPWNSKRRDFRDPNSLGFSLLHHYHAVYYRASFYLLDVWKGVARWGEVLGCPLSCRTQRGGRHDNLLSTLRLTVWSPTLNICWIRPCYFSCDGFYSGMGGGEGGKGGEEGNLKILKGGRLAITSSENWTRCGVGPKSLGVYISWVYSSRSLFQIRFLSPFDSIQEKPLTPTTKNY